MKIVVKISILFALCIFLNKAWSQKQGLEAIDSMKKGLTAFKPDSDKVRAIYHITDAYMSINHDSAIAYAKAGLALAQQLKWEKGIGPNYDAIGRIYSDNGRYKEAFTYYELSYQLSEKLNNKYNMASTLNNIGSLYQREGDFAKSQEYNFKALKIAEEINAYKLIAVLQINSAKIYFTEKDYEKSLYYNFKALKSFEKLNNKGGIADSYNSIANTYFEQKKMADAGRYYNMALSLYRSTDDQIGIASALSQIGLLYDNDIDKKLDYLLRAQEIFDKANPMFTISITNVGNIGDIYADIVIHKKISLQKKYRHIPDNYAAISTLASDYLKKAVSYSAKAGDRDNLSYFLGVLAGLQQHEGDYKTAFKNLIRSQTLEDSIYSQASKNKIAALEAQYTFRKKEDAYKQQQQITQLKMKQIFLYAALAIVLISAFAIYLLDRSRISQLRLKNQLQRKEAEELQHRNKLSESELKAIRAQMNPHFIFNVLNSIESYVLENDSKTASRLIQKFASLSRLILENSTQSLVAAEREWKALKLYTELEAIRFNHHFTYSFREDPGIDLSSLMIPPMLVQPLIENAIHHGLRNSSLQDNAVNVRLEQNDNDILFTVEDNGIGIDEARKFKTTSSVKSKSIGLSAIKERIEIINQMNDNAIASLIIHKKDNNEGSGTIAILTLPKVFRRE